MPNSRSGGTSHRCTEFTLDKWPRCNEEVTGLKLDIYSRLWGLHQMIVTLGGLGGRGGVTLHDATPASAKALLCDGVAHFIRSIMFIGNILRGFILLPPRSDFHAHYIRVY